MIWIYWYKVELYCYVVNIYCYLIHRCMIDTYFFVFHRHFINMQ